MSDAPQTTAIVPVGFEDKILEIFKRDFEPWIEKKGEFYAEVAATVAELKATDAASLAVVDEWERDLLAERDALEAVRASGPGALNRLGRKMGAPFKPLFDALEASISNLKTEKGNFILAERNKQAESYQAAAAAHVAGDHGAAQTLMLVANEAETMAPKGTSVGEKWVVERYELSLMVLSTEAHPGLIPDEQAINAYLRKLSPNEEPALPGVICKKVPVVVTRHAKGNE